jgi:hypothetical protein
MKERLRYEFLEKFEDCYLSVDDVSTLLQSQSKPKIPLDIGNYGL